MQEIEVKILNVNRPKLEKILARLGAKKVFDGDIEAFFFDFKDGSIAKAKSVMRLRREGSQVVLTFKQVKSKHGAKVADEQSVEVSDLEVMKKILQSLGLSVTGSTQKQRVSYQLGKVHFDFDCYKGENSCIPEFMEIEAESLETIYKYAELFGFKAKDCLPWTINDLINYYSTKKPC